MTSDSTPMAGDDASDEGTATLCERQPDAVPAALDSDHGAATGWLPAAMARPPHPRAAETLRRAAETLPRKTLPMRRQPVRRRSGLARWFSRHRFALDVLLGATLMVLVHTFVVQISVVKGHSMEPSLLDGDRLVVDRVAYRMADVRRGDVVVLRYPRNPQVDFVKRVIGLPG